MLHPDDALKKLLDGNKRFIRGAMTHSNITPERRLDLIKGQTPFVAVLTCSDSRVVPEIIFDCGLGDIFDVRIAGAVLNNDAIGSIEYAVDVLGVKLVIVLGHDGCGVIDCALKNVQATDNINALCNHVNEYFTEDAKDQISTNEASKVVTLNNAKNLSNQDIEAFKIKNHEIKIIPAHYNFLSGEVEILS